MRFIAFDLELTCDKDAQDYPYQIIEIAAVSVVNGEICSTFQSYVKPNKAYDITPFCTELTGITTAQIAAAPTITQVMASLSTFIQQASPELIMSWGKSDYTQLEKECSDSGISFPLSTTPYQDFKKNFCKQRKIKRVGLQTALKIYNLTAEGRPHSALSDAINLARLYINVN
jgi:3'-5' exoribonuclease 1